MLRDRLPEQLRESMKSRDAVRTSTIRLLMTAVRNAEVEKRGTLDDDGVLEVVVREAKRRREAIDAYSNAGRDDLVAKESAELAVLEAYLPEPLSDEDLDRLVDAAIAEVGAQGPKQMGAVMKALMPKVKGRADGAAVSGAVRVRLGG